MMFSRGRVTSSTIGGKSINFSASTKIKMHMRNPLIGLRKKK